MTVVVQAPPVSRPNLSGLRVMVIGRGDNATKPLEDYFTQRGAAVISESLLTARAFAANQRNDNALRVDVAVLVSDGSDDDASETTHQLRDLHVVPLLYGIGRSPSRRLRQGFAAVIPADAGAEYIDRNIRLLVGHAKSRERLAEQQESVASAYSPTLSGKRVLVLEDRLLNQTVIQKQLKKLGVDCVLVGNGVKGLEMLDRQQFNLILCDCSMPLMNGYEFTQALRVRESSLPESRRIPIIALTANAFREDVDRCMAAGMDDFISKPVTMDRLAATLFRWLNPLVAAPGPVATQTDTVNTGARPAIDEVALQEILGADSSDVLNDVLAQFTGVSLDTLSNVKVAVSTCDPQQIVSAAHAAKGEARCAAATELATLYAELEGNASDLDRAASRELVGRIEVEVRRVELYIRERLGAKVS